jgi:hypothetical protein
MSFDIPVLLRILTTISTPSTSSKARRAPGASTRTHNRVSMVLDASASALVGVDGLETVLVVLDRGVGDMCLEMDNRSARI